MFTFVELSGGKYVVFTSSSYFIVRTPISFKESIVPLKKLFFFISIYCYYSFTFYVELNINSFLYSTSFVSFLFSILNSNNGNASIVISSFLNLYSNFVWFFGVVTHKKQKDIK